MSKDIHIKLTIGIYKQGEMKTATDIHSSGQYFTTNPSLQETIYKFILNSPTTILEPSIGRGDLVEYVINKKPSILFDMYEIDNTLSIIDKVSKENIKYTDFLTANIDTPYKTIIGNPPFVKTSQGNLYIDFTTKCYNLLENNGELIFIVPTDFFKLTSSYKLLNTMLNNGTFTHIYHPNNEHLFENATIDVLVFRYCKNKELNNKVMYNDTIKYLINTNGTITFSDNNITNTMKCISEYFDIYVGMVTGKESIFKNSELGNIDLLNGKNKIDRYILAHSFPTNNSTLDQYLLSNKTILMNRRIRKFNSTNWFEWGALRNFKNIQKNFGKECIFINNLTRNKEVAFLDKVQYFGGSLLMMIPKTTIDLKKMVNHLNSLSFKQNYMYSGRFKIGHRQLSNSLVEISHIS